MPADFDVADIRAEDALLLCCARTTIEEETAEKIEFLVRDDLDWDYIIRRSLHHRIVPLLYRNLKQHGLNSIPSAIAYELQYHYQAIARRNLHLTAELARLVIFLENHGIPCIPYKGPALAFLAYRNISLRTFGDLDILVDPHDYTKARDVLLAQAYRQRADYGYECSLVDAKSAVCIDLHQGFTPVRFPTNTDFGSLRQRVLAPPGAVGRLITFCPEDMLIVLAIQLSKDGWVGGPLPLIKVCDIAELIRSHPGMDWKWILRESERIGCQGMLSVSLSIAHQLLDAPIPELALQSPSRRTADLLTSQIYDRLISRTISGDTKALSMEKFHFKLRERWRDKLYPLYHYLKQRILPNDRDYQFVALPRSLTVLYYVTRPIRFAYDYIRLVLNRPS